MTRRAGRIGLLIVLLVLAGAWSRPARAEVGFDLFYSSLSPYGAWTVSARYGRVWQPSVYAEGWNPYYDGHWVYSDLGWTWVSDYEWGAIPYHYGTWVVDPAVGWVWVPGYVWAPAWVVFRTGPDFIGWAPVSPGFSIGVSFGSGPAVSGPFVFVAARDFLAPRLHTCVIPPGRTRLILGRTTIVRGLAVERGLVVNRGPDVRIVERASGRRIRMVPIEGVSRVVPDRHFSRERIAAETRGAGRGLRAAEPVAPSGRMVAQARPRTEARQQADRRQPMDRRQQAEPRQEGRPRQEARPRQQAQPRGRPRAEGGAPNQVAPRDHGHEQGHVRPRQHDRPPEHGHP